MDDLAQFLFDQADLTILAQRASLQEGIAIGKREPTAMREALRCIVVAYDLALSDQRVVISTPLHAAIENARAVLK